MLMLGTLLLEAARPGERSDTLQYCWGSIACTRCHSREDPASLRDALAFPPNSKVSLSSTTIRIHGHKPIVHFEQDVLPVHTSTAVQVASSLNKLDAPLDIWSSSAYNPSQFLISHKR